MIPIIITCFSLSVLAIIATLVIVANYRRNNSVKDFEEKHKKRIERFRHGN